VTEDPERELTPDEDARIRSLLASARAEEQVPDDVVARLDSVLADLAEDRDAEGGAGRTPGSRPRWRRGRVLLAAAVGVGVIGVAAVSLPQLGGVQDSGGSSDKALSAPETDTSGSSAGEPPAGALAATSRLSTASFRRDVRRLLAADAEGRRLAPAGSPAPSGERLASGACPPSPAAGVVRSREVLLDGKPALLEIFGVRDGARVVRAVSCDGTETLATTRIPAD
jgi:hypothetical protein